MDARRIAYLESLLPRTLPRARRTAIATLEYAAFLGAQKLPPRPKRMRAPDRA